MQCRRICAVSRIATHLLTVGLLLFTASAIAAERIDLRVLYLGKPDSERLADFRRLLADHFAKVTTADLRTFKEADANGQDIVIVDWTNEYKVGGGVIDGKGFRAPQISKDFTRPMILIGQAGGKVTLQLDIKIDWLCLCLSGPAYKVATKHELFHSPLKVEPVFEEIPTPELDRYLTVEQLGTAMQVWHVQTKNYPDGADPGLVSTLYGFADSPDAEVIAQGIARKGPETVALARQANYFLWGFSAPPADMTPAAQRLFVNVVAYMHKFDGDTPLVRRVSMPREWALRLATVPRLFNDDYRQRKSRVLRASYQKHPKWVEEKYKGDVERQIIDRIAAEEKANRDWMLTNVPKALQEQFGMDADKYVTYYREHFEYLRPVEGDTWAAFLVDDDAKSLGLSNRKVELLDRCVSMLEKYDRPELALRLLKRYTHEVFAFAEQWRGWLDNNRSRLFFSDMGGYKFFIGPDTAQ